MTEQTHSYLADTSAQFMRAVAHAVADVLRHVPEEDQVEARYYLQDHLSLFSPFMADAIDDAMTGPERSPDE